MQLKLTSPWARSMQKAALQGQRNLSSGGTLSISNGVVSAKSALTVAVGPIEVAMVTVRIPHSGTYSETRQQHARPGTG